MSGYIKKTDTIGKIWMWSAAVLVVMVPVAICVYFNSWPKLTDVLNGLLGVAPVFWTVGVVEIITYTPMLGVGGTYLAFVTGNLTSIKAPAALTAMENAEVKADTEEGEVISTIAIATSSIVTTLIIVVGVVLFSFVAPIIDSPQLAPAFANSNLMAALFGGLGVVYISKNWKISVAPVVFMVTLFLLFPSLAGSVGVLVPVGVIVTLVASRILYKKGLV